MIEDFEFGLKFVLNACLPDVAEYNIYLLAGFGSGIEKNMAALETGKKAGKSFILRQLGEKSPKTAKKRFHHKDAV